MKLITGKYNPISQWLYMDCAEVVPLPLRNGIFDPLASAFFSVVSHPNSNVVCSILECK
jgi:hypothetical protein